MASNAYLSDHMIVKAVYATFFMLSFANRFLGYNQKQSKSHRVVSSIRYGILLLTGLSFFIPYVVAIAYGSQCTFFSDMFIYIHLPYAERWREAVFYFSAWSVFIVACIIYLLKQFGILLLMYLYSI